MHDIIPTSLPPAVPFAAPEKHWMVECNRDN